MPAADEIRMSRRVAMTMNAVREYRADVRGVGFVYGIKPEGLDFLKIGYCRDTYDRRKTLQVAWPVDLNWVFLMRGDKNLEVNIHGALYPCHIRGDWFRWEELTERFVAELLAEFPGAKVPEPKSEPVKKCDHFVAPGGWCCARCGVSPQLFDATLA